MREGIHRFTQKRRKFYAQSATEKLGVLGLNFGFLVWESLKMPLLDKEVAKGHLARGQGRGLGKGAKKGMCAKESQPFGAGLK